MLQEFKQRLVNGAGNLTEEEASAALEAILAPESSDTDIASFLLALAEKGETSEEVAGFVRVMRRLAVKVECDHEVFVDTAGTGGGTATFNVSTAAAFVISGSGVPVAKHGNRAITSRCGSADVLSELGVQVGRPPEVSEKALNEIGICFMFAPGFHPAMKRVAQIRRELGRRTIFNMIGPLTNPASAPFQLIGVYAQELTQILGEALLRLGCRKAWVVHAADGLDEMSVSAETRVVEVDESGLDSFDFKPIARSFEIPEGGSPEHNATLIRGILDGRIAGPARDLVVLNAAAAIHIATGESMTASLNRAQKAVTEGAAREKLDELVAAYAE